MHPTPPDPTSPHRSPPTRPTRALPAPSLLLAPLVASLAALLTGCSASSERAPEYFLLRPAVEKAYGYAHAVRVARDIRISGAVSMDDRGELLAPGDLEQQMKNCYADLARVLAHYGCTFADVTAENIYTTDMQGFIKVAGYRRGLYNGRFPTGTWLEVKGLALPGQLIEIDMEARAPR